MHYTSPVFISVFLVAAVLYVWLWLQDSLGGCHLVHPLSFSNNCVQFTTVVSAQFWLLKLPAWMASDKLAIADRIFRSDCAIL